MPTIRDETPIEERVRLMEECLAGMADMAPPKAGDAIQFEIRQHLARQMEFLRVWKNHQAGKLRWISDASLAIVSAAIGGAIASYVTSMFHKG